MPGRPSAWASRSASSWPASPGCGRMPKKASEEPAVARSVLPDLDPLLESRSRLGICVLLCRYQALSFSRLKAVLRETDGNLGAHLRKLEDHGYLTVRKEFVERRPVSWYGLSKTGRAALKSHVGSLGELIRGLKTQA